MTTFIGTFSFPAVSSSTASDGNTTVRGQAAHAGNSGGAPEQAVSTSVVDQQPQQQSGGSATTS